MTKSDISYIKASIDEIKLIIDNFMADADKGLVTDLSRLEYLVEDLGSKLSDLPSSSLGHIQEDFESMLVKMGEVKWFLNEEVENTRNRIRTVNASIKATKQYGAAANDNS